MSGAELAVLLPMLGEAAAGTAATATPLAAGMVGAGAPTALGAMGGSALAAESAAMLGMPAMEAGLLGGSAATPLAGSMYGMGATGAGTAAAAPYAAGMGPGMGAAGAWQQALAGGLPADAGTAANGFPWKALGQAAGQGLLSQDDQQQRAPATPLPQQQQAGNMVDAGTAWMQGGLLAGLDPKTRAMLMARMKGARA